MKQFVHSLPRETVISNGRGCMEFEDTVRDYYGAKYALSCGNCTVGLLLALRALKSLYSLSNALIPSFTWVSTEFAAQSAGLRVAYRDIDPDSWLMQPEENDSNRSVAVPVWTFGGATDPDRYVSNVPHVLIDAAHALGTPFSLGSADGAVLSFAPSKILTCGEGGMLITDSTELAVKFSDLRRKFSRMSEANAAMGLAHWNGLEAQLRDRRTRWNKYKQIPGFTPQKTPLTNYSTSAFRVKNRDLVNEGLKHAGIETRIYYDPLWKGLPNTDELFSEILCLPSWYGCPTDVVIKAIHTCLESNK